MSQIAEPRRFLWILVCDSGPSDELIPIYALSQQGAEQQAQKWIAQSPRKVNFKELRACPGGFRLGWTDLPGSIPGP